MSEKNDPVQAIENCEPATGNERLDNSMARPINCDQVSWMLNAIWRYLPNNNHPAISRAREMQKYALLYEIMECADLRFEDDRAAMNGTPPDVQRLAFKR